MPTKTLINIDCYKKSFQKFLKEIIYKDNSFSLLIRPLQDEDSTVIHNAIESSLKDLVPFMEWAHKDLTIESQSQRIDQSKKAYLACSEFDFAVLNLESNEFLMSASLSKPRAPNRSALSIGYWTASKFSNRGIATIVTKILTVIAFEVMNCDRVEIGCNKANFKSAKVIEKCGFIFEGEARNYFTEATESMIKNGYNPERTCAQFALTTLDLENILWYKDIKDKILIVYPETER